MTAGHIERATSDEEKLRALETVLNSDTFSRADRLKRLLTFLCEAEIQGRHGQLTEYSIGVQALGRPEDFSPIEDSYVRSRAYELRHKLDKFYAEEAPSTPVRIELRKGSYVPRFSIVQAAEPEPEPVFARPDPQPAVPARQSRSRASLAFAALSGALLTTLLFALWWNIANPAQGATSSLWTPAMESLWRPFLSGNTPLTIAYESRLFVQIGPVLARDSRVDRASAIPASELLGRIQRLFPGEPVRPSLNYTDAGDPRAVFYLTRLLADRTPSLTIRSSAELSASDFSASNLILLGKPHMDPRVERFLSRGELIDELGTIRNVHPAPTEQLVYRDQHDADDPDLWGEKYAVITSMPGSTPGHRILALTGSGSEHPGALAWYITDPARVAELLHRMGVDPGHSPNFFQVLVRIEFRNGAPIKVEYVTHRSLNHT